jgi:hypothetical protein
MPSFKISPSEAILIDLIHDLRQPLGNIETTLYCLGLTGEPAQTRAGGYLRTIEHQVARAASLLSDASAELARLRAQRVECAGPAEILEFTNSATSAVT